MDFQHRFPSFQAWVNLADNDGTLETYYSLRYVYFQAAAGGVDCPYRSEAARCKLMLESFAEARARAQNTR